MSSTSSSPSPNESSEKFSIFNPSKMEYVRLGKTGLQVSRICLGMMSYGSPSWQPWVLGESEGIEFIKSAMQMGINFFDTADIYSLGISEEILGKAIRRYMKREEVVIATKLYFSLSSGGAFKNPQTETPPNSLGLSRKHIFEACEASLKRLGVDYIDLYQIHRFDRNTPVEETMRALNDLVRMGKVRYIGASSMYAWQFQKMQYVAESLNLTKFVSMQNHYNLIYREEEREMIPLCKDMGVGLIPWSPLARGFLCGGRTAAQKESDSKEGTLRTQTDKFLKSLYFSPEDFVVAERVEELAKKRNVTPAMVAIAWIITKVDSPIIGATKMKHLEEAVEAIHLKLNEDEIKFIEEKYTPHKVLGNLQ